MDNLGAKSKEEIRRRNLVVHQVLEDWWRSSADAYTASNGERQGKWPIKLKWKKRWPWEQAKIYKAYDDHVDHVQILSFPDKQFIPWTSKKKPNSQYPTDYVEPWCFSHWPGANCFITHSAASKNQKLKMHVRYGLPFDSNEYYDTYFIEDVDGDKNQI